TFPPGTVTRTITVAVLSDALDEADETFFVNLSAAVAANIVDGQGAGTIVDDDGAPSLTIAGAIPSEGDSGSTPAVFTVRLSAPSGKEVRVDFATADGTATAGEDYLANAGTLVFAPGITE